MSIFSHIDFTYPYLGYFIFLTGMTVLLVAYVWQKLLQKKVLKSFSKENQTFLIFPFPRSIRRIQVLLCSFVLLCLSLAAAWPSYLMNSEVKTSAKLVFLLDISGSMGVKDVNGESRLKVAKRAIQTILQGLPRTQAALYLFNTSPYLEVPMTQDRTSFLAALDSLQEENPSGGTDLNTALNSIHIDADALILLTDGETPPSVDKNKLPLFVVMLGTAVGGPVGHLEKNGKAVISKADINTLTALSPVLLVENTVPEYFIKKLPKREETIYTFKPVYAIPLLLAIPALIGLIFLGKRYD